MKKNNENYILFLSEIRNEIQIARITAVRETVKTITKLYFKIGKMIVSRQEKYGWGSSIINKLAEDIKRLENITTGFSVTNLKYMRQFYLEYKSNENLQNIVFKIPWGHNILIMQKIKNEKEKQYYLRATKEYSWSRNVLLNQIKANAFSRHKLVEKQHNFPATLPKHLAEQADEAMKDTYVLDFLRISKPVLEREMEQRMVNKIRDVLVEFGYGFAFMGNQYRIQTETKEYFIDLLFYHRILKCLIAVELKVGDFKPEYAGKMNFYLNILDEYVREEGENPSIGIILCAQRDRIEVEYALKGINKPVGVSDYKLTQKLPKELSDKLPSVKNIKEKILNRIKEDGNK